MYNPVSQDLIFQQMDELREEMRQARVNSGARRHWRRERAERRHSRRTR